VERRHAPTRNGESLRYQQELIALPYPPLTRGKMMEEYTTEEEIKKLTDIAYLMEQAYKNNRDRKSAVNQVMNQHKNADNFVLVAMWQAIDAYVDLNT